MAPDGRRGRRAWGLPRGDAGRRRLRGPAVSASQQDVRVDDGPWNEALRGHLATPGFAALRSFVAAERARAAVYPSPENEFRALRETPPDRVSLLLLGQDPYHGPGQADGLAFSVPAGTKLPPSLRNLFKERASDLGLAVPPGGDLTPWAREGVLLLNTTLTVRAGEPLSHAKRGWEAFTDAVLAHLASGPPIVFLLLGSHAQKKVPLVDQIGGGRHRVILGVHPSPLSASRGFFGSRPFSQVNEALAALSRAPLSFRVAGDLAGVGG
jgi:uracil-DNA glycosylase